MAAPATEMNLTEARIAERTLPKGGWSEAARTDALARLRRTGLPQRRDEYWKFTRPDLLTQVGAQAAVFEHSEAPIFGAMDALRIVFDDGVFNAEASDALAMEHVSIERLADTDVDIHWAKGVYGVLETAGQTPVARPLAALNTAFASVAVYVGQAL